MTHPLIDAAESYLLARPACRGYARQIRSRIRAFVAWLDGGDVTVDAVNAFIASIEAKGRQPETTRGYRTSVVAVLKFAGCLPGGSLRSVRVRDNLIECFTHAQILALIAAGARMTGTLPNGVPRREFWPLAIDAGYTTGLRWGDLTDLSTGSVEHDGRCQVIQSKTGKMVPVKFSEKAVATIRRHGQEKAVPWPHSGNHFRMEFRALTIAAGVSQGSWKWLRRSAGSYTEDEQPGCGHKLLGNNQATFTKHYWAFGTVSRKPLEPPPLRRPWWRRLFRW